MVYLDNIAVLDMEMTGLDSQKCAILSVGIVSYTKKLNEFYREYYPFDDAEIVEAGMAINGFDLTKMEKNSINNPKNVVEDVKAFLMANNCNVIAGQNPSVDRSFINAYAERFGSDFRIPIWMLDMHSTCLAYMIGKNITVPRKPDGGLFLTGDSILEFTGLGSEPKPHNALNGARYEFEALCRIIYGESVLPQFKDCKMPNILLK